MGINYKEDKYKPMAAEDPVNSQVFVDQIFERLGIDMSDPSRQLMVQWKSIVGPSIAEHVKCEGIKDGAILVSCDHPSRASYIRINEKDIIKTVLSVFPELKVKKISARVHR